MDPVVHFELPADDVKRASTFYGKVFGWKVNAIPGMGYTLLHTAPTDAQGMLHNPGNINGGMVQRQFPIERLLITVEVPDMGRALEQVKVNGGRVVREAMEVPGVGMAAYVQDTEGNTLGLMQPLRP